MKRNVIALLFVLILAANLFGSGFSYQFDLTSRFIFRGIDILYQNKPAFQPSVTYTFENSGFSLNAWASFCLSNREIYKYTDEIDLTLDYTFKTPEKYSLSVGFTNYGYWFSKDFTFSKHTTQEFYVKAGLPQVIFSPRLTLYYDVNLGDGLYVELSGKHTLKLNEKFNLDLSAKLGYNAGMFIPEGEDTGVSDFVVGASLPIKTGKFTIAPFVNYAIIFLDSLNPNDNEFWLGVSLIF